MSLSFIRNAFYQAKYTEDWSLQLLSIKYPETQDDKTLYKSRHIILYPEDKICELAKEIIKRYTSTKKCELQAFSDVLPYDGSANAATIYKLHGSDELLAENYNSFISSVNDPSREANPFCFQTAYVLSGTITINEVSMPIRMASMKNPIITLKHKYMEEDGAFREYNRPVLSIGTLIDVLIVNNTVYLFTPSGEKLFNIEHAYKKACAAIVESLAASNIIANFDDFRKIANSGHNPKRFVAFNQQRFDKLQDVRTRRTMARKFQIQLDENDCFDASLPGVAEKLVKLLCNKGMVDPFDKNGPVEVSGSRKWV